MRDEVGSVSSGDDSFPGYCDPVLGTFITHPMTTNTNSIFSLILSSALL